MKELLAPSKTVTACFCGLMYLFFVSSGVAQVRFNVKDFGAIGDARQFHATTTSNSFMITTTEEFSSADIGKPIQVFGAGKPTFRKNADGTIDLGHEDLITEIADVLNGTNLYLKTVCFASLTEAYATAGTDNSSFFQRGIDACAGYTNAFLHVPAGKYLLLSTYKTHLYASVALELRNGGINIVGEGPDNTILLSQGAWTVQRDKVWRGYLFAVVPPINNDYPVSISDLTMDGGVLEGNTSSHGFPASKLTGNGWDESHAAYNIRGFTGNVFSHTTWSNLVITRWRGEMVKSNDASTNGHLDIINCKFVDGNATAINIYPSLNITNCVFENLFQVGEYFMKYSTNVSVVQNCLFTNITANGFAFNGATGTNPPFILRNNNIHLAGKGYSAVLTTPGANILIESNTFVFADGASGTGVLLGAAGYQGYCNNSNIVIRGNTFINPNIVLQIAGDPAGNNESDNVTLINNSVIADRHVSLLRCYNWSTNVYLYSNDCSRAMSVGLTSGARGGQFATVDTNNIYFSKIYDLKGVTNFVNYANGSKFEMIYKLKPGTIYALVTTNAAQIPPGAKIVIKNAVVDGGAGTTVPLFTSDTLTGAPRLLTQGDVATFSWNGTTWQAARDVAPPRNIRVVQ